MDVARTSAVPLIGGDRQQLTPSRHQQVRGSAPCRSSRHPSGRDMLNSAISPAFNSDTTHATGIREPRRLPGPGHHSGPTLHRHPRKALPSTCSTRGAGLGSRCVWSAPPRHRAPRRDGERVRDRRGRARALRAGRAEGARAGIFVGARHRFVRLPAGAIDPVHFEDTCYLGAGENGERGYRVLAQALQKTHRIAVDTFTWRGKTTPIAIRVNQDGLLL
jgi:hypothetical protein